jgi:RNA polymerase sigma-70 factor (ECF subfamily)
MGASSERMQELVQDHAPGLKLYARSLGADEASAEDVVADAFAGLWQQLVRGKSIDSPAAYLAQSVRHGVARHGKRETRRRDIERDGAVADWFHVAAGRETAERTGTLLAALPDAQREVVVLRIWADMTFQEIATALGIPLSTAGHRYRTALAALREMEADT